VTTFTGIQEGAVFGVARFFFFAGVSVCAGAPVLFFYLSALFVFFLSVTVKRLTVLASIGSWTLLKKKGTNREWGKGSATHKKSLLISPPRRWTCGAKGRVTKALVVVELVFFSIL
jgi:hypothetical protein